jgi:hypothetical protein
MPAREKGEDGKKRKEEQGRTDVTGDCGRSDATQVERNEDGSDAAS